MWRGPSDRSLGPDSVPTRCFTTSYARICLPLRWRVRWASRISRTTTDFVVRRAREVAVRRASSSGDTLHVIVGISTAYYDQRRSAIPMPPETYEARLGDHAHRTVSLLPLSCLTPHDCCRNAVL